MTTIVRYVPADPGNVTTVDQLRLYATPDRTGTSVADVGPAVTEDSITWQFTLPDLPDGLYYTRTTVTYDDASTQDDIDDTLRLPLVEAAQLGDPLALWVSVADVQAVVAGASEEQAQAAARTATDVLYALSGRRFPGLRVGTLRVPPTVLGGGRELLPTSLPWGSLGSRRGCGACAVEFDPILTPIRSVVRMSIGGTDVPAEQIDASNGRTIRVVRGIVSDPLAVNYWCGPDGAYSLFPGSCGCARPGVEVTLTWGRDVPVGGAQAARLLAIELCKALTGDTTCRLPGNVVSVNRQGVSVVLDPTTLLDKGRTGIPTVDLWLQSVNPHQRQAEPLLWSPEMPFPEVVG